MDPLGVEVFTLSREAESKKTFVLPLVLGRTRRHSACKPAGSLCIYTDIDINICLLLSLAPSLSLSIYIQV